MKTYSQRCALLVVLAVVATGIFFQLQRDRPPTIDAAALAWKHRIPTTIAGWETREEPLGDTEYQERVVLDALQLEHYVHRAYYKEGRYVAVFVAWWPPGRIPTRLVAFHSPDICWTSQGLHCTTFVNRRPIKVQGRTWHPAEWRTFVEADGAKSEVLFWLLVGGTPYDFGTGLGHLPGPWAWFGDLCTRLTGKKQEHLLVRIATNGTWEECLNDPDLASALARIGEVGLNVGKSDS